MREKTKATSHNNNNKAVTGKGQNTKYHIKEETVKAISKRENSKIR